MSCLASVAWCSLLSRMARMPPWTLGCSVLTLPSIISGKPVTSQTSLTGRRASPGATTPQGPSACVTGGASRLLRRLERRAALHHRHRLPLLHGLAVLIDDVAMPGDEAAAAARALHLLDHLRARVDRVADEHRQ